MQSTVTLDLHEYNEIFMNSTLCEQYKQENKMLKEDLVIAHKHLEELQQPKTGKPTYTVKLDGSEVYEAVKKAVAEVKEELEKEELLLKQREDIKAWHRALNKRDSNCIIAYDNEGNEIRFAKNGIYLNGDLIQESNN